MSRRKGGAHEEEHPDERWLVTYADMVTLLMVLFIIMFAMSTVDEQKYQDLKSGLQEGFGHSSSILDGAAPTIDDQGPVTPSVRSLDALLKELSPSERSMVAAAVENRDRLREDRERADAENEVARLMETWKQIDVALRRAGLRDDVRATVDERGLVVSLVSRHVVFLPNIAELTERGRRVVDTIAPVLEGVTEPIQVDGHTNQVPVKPKYYPTDWELSVARAVHVLRRLEEVNGLPESRLRATGFGHTEPLVDPDRPGSQRVNKRVDLVVLSQAPAGTRAKFEEVFAEYTADSQEGLS